MIRIGEGVYIRAFLNLWQQWDVTAVERSGMKLRLRSNQKKYKGKMMEVLRAFMFAPFPPTFPIMGA